MGVVVADRDLPTGEGRGRIRHCRPAAKGGGASGKPAGPPRCACLTHASPGGTLECLALLCCELLVRSCYHGSRAVNPYLPLGGRTRRPCRAALLVEPGCTIKTSSSTWPVLGLLGPHCWWNWHIIVYEPADPGCFAKNRASRGFRSTQCDPAAQKTDPAA
jgi:hypothetical protein